jgi:putative membrane protein insertion efficiency factor
VKRLGTVAARLRNLLVALVLLPIRVYRRLVSPFLPARCKYHPTCSAYAEQAIRELGVVRGSIVAAHRVLRCNPLSHGGLDPLSDRRLFRDPAARRGRRAVA